MLSHLNFTFSYTLGKNHHNNPVKYYPHFIDEKTEAQRRLFYSY